jgi:GT2 family glycosyltransferase
MTDISVVMVSWNTAQRLSHAIDAVRSAAEGLDVEIIVVDNGSTDGTRTLLAEKFPDVLTVQHEENLGFARGCNAGARLATGRALLFLNSDCEVAPGALGRMLAALDAAPALGAVLPRLTNPDGTLQPSVHDRLPTPWSLLGEACFLGSLRYAIYRHPEVGEWLRPGTRARHARTRDVAWGGAACLLVRREAWVAVGGFDERFFMYCEDVDFCARLTEAGWRIRFVAEASAVHYWGASAAHRPRAALIAPWLSRLRYHAKHAPGWGPTVAYPVLALDLAVRRTVFGGLALLPARRAWGRTRAAEASAAAEAIAREGAQLGVAGSGVTLFLLLVLSAAAVRFAHDAVKFAVTSDFIDFAHYYTYARLVAEGANPFDPGAIAAMDARLRLPRSPGAADYPPLFYLLVQPWTSLPFRAGALAWLATAHLCVAATAAMLLRWAPAALPARMAAVLFVGLMYQPLYEDLAVGQSNTVLLALVTAAWWQARRGHAWLAGAALGLAVHVKPQYGLVVPLLALAGRVDVAGRAIVVGSVGFAIGLAVLGIDHYTAWVHEITRTGFEFIFAWNISASAILRRLGRLVEAPAVTATILTWIVNAGVLAVVVGAMLRRERDTADAQWALALTSVILVSPMLEEHHFVLLLFPIAVVLLQPAPERASGPADAALALGAILLLASRYSVVRFETSGSLVAVLLAGKWLGAAALAWVLARRIRAA